MSGPRRTAEELPAYWCKNREPVNPERGPPPMTNWVLGRPPWQTIAELRRIGGGMRFAMAGRDRPPEAMERAGAAGGISLEDDVAKIGKALEFF
jgi:hypothetical protein